jgi:hypothetical protein
VFPGRKKAVNQAKKEADESKKKQPIQPLRAGLVHPGMQFNEHYFR